MPIYPHTIDNGAGEQLTFLGRTRTANGERIEVDGTARPGAGPPMHVHYLQEERVLVVTGRAGYQVPGQPERIAGPGQVVVWPAGTPHRWWNAGDTELRMTGWCAPPGNVEFYLSAMFASMKENGGKRPGLFDAAFLTTRYQSEFAMLEMPTVIRRLVVPLIYALGLAIGKFAKYKDAPPPISSERPPTTNH
jgi:quercetin dioxygenase-like cupin family protein